MRIIAAWAGGSLLWILLAGSAAAQQTITKTEFRTAPPARTHHRLRDVVWDMFEVSDMRRSKRAVARLTDVVLEAKLRGTSVPGLCRSDTLWVEFAPEEAGRRDADAPVKAVGFTATSSFAFLTPPRRPYEKAVDYVHAPPETDCTSLKGHYNRFFQAGTEELAYEGYRIWMALRKALHDKQPVPLECYLNGSEKQPCADFILAFKPDDVQSIAACEAPDSGHSCYLLWVDDHEIRIVVASRFAEAPAADTILKVKLESLIVMRHERID